MKKSVYYKETAPATQSQPHLPLVDVNEGSNLLQPGGSKNDGEDNTIDLDLEKHGNMHAAASNVHSRLDLAATIAPVSLQPTKSSGTENSAAILQQSIRMKILSSAQNPAATLMPTTVDSNALPQHSVISRAFVSAFGRLGRWRRELTARSRNPAALACAAGFDPEADAPYAGDLLTNKDGLEQYLRNMKADSVIKPNLPSASTQTSATVGGDSVDVTPGVSEDGVLDITPSAIDRKLAAGAVPVDVDEADQLLNDDESSIHASVSSAVLSTRLRPEIVSLDDYEFSDSEASGYGEEHPPGLRPVRRLPLRSEFERDFELIGRESVSSLGGNSRFSLGAGGGNRDSVASDGSMPGPGGIQYWQLQVMLDAQRSEESDEEPGDVTAALRRLEGQIDSSQQQVKETQVEGWLKTVARRKRDAGSDYAPSDPGSESEPTTPLDEPPNEGDAVTSDAKLQDARLTPSSSDPNSTLAGASIDANSTVFLTKETELSPVALRAGNRFAPTQSLRPQIHRSFVLQYSSEQIAKQWCLIDRDFFLAVKFEELTFEDQSWKQLRMHAEVTDWSLYMKERMKMRLEASVNPDVKMPTTFTTSRLRFNMMVKFVASEIVLSVPLERIDVVSKFIRIAWVN